MNLFKYLGYGYLILVTAVIINGVMKRLGTTTWYDYFQKISESGIKTATLSLHPAELIFLLILYPGIFGIIIYVAVQRNS